MRFILAAAAAAILFARPGSHHSTAASPAEDTTVRRVSHQPGTWPYYLQHLPEKKGPVVDYTGSKIKNQDKHTAVLNFDVGTRDLQQCADALMRLRAEYLFGAGKANDIGFHFTDGTLYKFSSYCAGLRPSSNGRKWRKVAGVAPTHEALRRYLDLVYTYAGTISLAKELKPADRFEVGTIIIRAGSPGHCCIIVDEAVNTTGKRLFKLAEGYTPAQSIYILRNPVVNGISPWYELHKGVIETSSYVFETYKLGKFE
jgi:hypothetical protein